MRTDGSGRIIRGLAWLWVGVLFIGTGVRVLASCAGFGLPFTDLGSTNFCAQIAEAYFSGLTNGTSATTYSPTASVPREQMAAFVTRTLDQSLLRGSRRAALDQWWTSNLHFNQAGLGLVAVGSTPTLLKSDGTDVWVSNSGESDVTRIRARDGANLGTWSGATGAVGVLIAMGKVFIAGQTTPGKLYEIDPSSSSAVPVSTVAGTLGNSPAGIAFDGNKIWTANVAGSVSIVSPGTWSVATVSTGFSSLDGILFDGVNIWVTDQGAGKLFKLNSSGAVVQTVTVGASPGFPAFDGHNIWVPNFSDNSLTVVRSSDGVVLKTFSAGNGDKNGLSSPVQAAFDGQRILVTNEAGGLSFFKAADLSIIGSFATSGVSNPYGACSDGTDFWVTFEGSSSIGRF